MLIESTKNYWPSTFRIKNKFTIAQIIDETTQILTKNNSFCVVGGPVYDITTKVAYEVVMSVLHAKASTLLLNYSNNEINITQQGLEIKNNTDFLMIKENFHSDIAYTKIPLPMLEEKLINLKRQTGLSVVVINTLLGFLQTTVGFDYEKNESKIKDVLTILRDILKRVNVSAIMIADFQYQTNEIWDTFQFIDLPYSHVLQGIVDCSLLTYELEYRTYGGYYPEFVSPP
ncbi:MAG: hypothetical protein HQK53_18840, partial [Oligoflexia bacterium]|nr:hypothetical protein [Oligoflexia bacterium]